MTALLSFSMVSCGEKTEGPGGGNSVADAISVTLNGKTDYVVVSASADRNYASQLASRISRKTNVILEKSTKVGDVRELEILVGDTGRKESDDLLSEVGKSGYAIAVVGSKLVAAWTHLSFFEELLDVFAADIIDNPVYGEEGRLQVPNSYRKIVRKDPPRSALFSDFLASGKSVKVSAEFVGAVPSVGNCSVAQGAASDGTHVYFVLRNGSDTEAVILKYTLNPFVLVGQSQVFNGGHCNDLTYCDKDGKIVLAHGQSQGKTLTMIDAKSLAVLGDVTITVGSGAITYNKSREVYAISQGGSSLHFADANLKVLTSLSRTDKTGYTAQGMGSDDDYVFFPMSGSADNVLVIYDWKGNFVTTVTVDVAHESESMFCVGDKYYVCFYAGSGKGALLYRITPEAA